MPAWSGSCGEVTVFPQAINLASTWDTLLIKKVASAISTEALPEIFGNRKGAYLLVSYY